MRKKFSKQPISASDSGARTAVYIDFYNASYDGTLDCYTYHGIDDASIILQHRFGYTQAEADYQGSDCIGGVAPEIAEYLSDEYGIEVENYRDYFNSGDYHSNQDSADACWWIYWV